MQKLSGDTRGWMLAFESVEFVADDGVAKEVEVDADLVSAAGEGEHF